MAVWEKVNTNYFASGLRIDPEYYQPFYLALERELFSYCKKKILDFAYLSEHIFNSENVKAFNYIEIAGVNTKSGEITSKEIFTNKTPSRAKYLMNGNEVLVSTVRPNRSAIAWVPKEFINYVASSGFAPLTTKEKKYRAFIYVWLKTKAITDWLIRHTTASMYPAVSSQDILASPIFQPNDSLLNLLSEKIDNTERLLINSNKLLPEAEQELFDRLQWNNFNNKHILSYKANSNDILNNSRLDPEYYQPKFTKLISFLKNKNAMKLGSFCNMPKRGVSPEYVENGNICIVNSQHLGNNGIIDVENLDRTSEVFYSNPQNQNAVLNRYNVLVYATGAYIGRTNCWLESEKAVAGIDCIIIQPQTSICNPVYLALFLNSEPGLMQANQKASGSAQRHLYPNDLSNYQIFIPQNKNGKPDLEWQKKLADKVVKAYKAKKEAKQKLREAIELVEREMKIFIRTN